MKAMIYYNKNAAAESQSGGVVVAKSISVWPVLVIRSPGGQQGTPPRLRRVAPCCQSEVHSDRVTADLRRNNATVAPMQIPHAAIVGHYGPT